MVKRSSIHFFSSLSTKESIVISCAGFFFFESVRLSLAVNGKLLPTMSSGWPRRVVVYPRVTSIPDETPLIDPGINGGRYRLGGAV